MFQLKYISFNYPFFFLFFMQLKLKFNSKELISFRPLFFVRRRARFWPYDEWRSVHSFVCPSTQTMRGKGLRLSIIPDNFH